jgi:ribosomal protein S18 acetylase RimI-like enzyme
MQARRGELVDVLDGAGAVALAGDGALGLVTWKVEDARSDAGATSSDESDQAGAMDAEIRALAVGAAARGQGVGAALLEAAEHSLRAAGASRAWLVTTNDNLAALALYHKAGWRLVALRAGALDELRRVVKPSLPQVGQHGIPLRDELELAKELGQST